MKANLPECSAIVAFGIQSADGVILILSANDPGLFQNPGEGIPVSLVPVGRAAQVGF